MSRRGRAAFRGRNPIPSAAAGLPSPTPHPPPGNARAADVLRFGGGGPSRHRPGRAVGEGKLVAKEFYVLRVASNKEEQVRDTLIQKVKLEGLGEGGADIVGRILVPTETVITSTPGKNNKAVRRTYERKLYPGYVFVEMQVRPDGTVPEQIWFVFKETAGVGDFIGSGGDRDKASKPTAMKKEDVAKMLEAIEKKDTGATGKTIVSDFKKGDKVKIKEGPFENFEGEVDEVVPAKGVVKVVVTIFGRKTPLELEYFQVEHI